MIRFPLEKVPGSPRNDSPRIEEYHQHDCKSGRPLREFSSFAGTDVFEIGIGV
jgi:hypothetical protein